jgi:hypothetical protein
VRATFLSVFAVREFRVLFSGLLMYALGFEFEILGLSVLVYARTGSSAWAAAAFSAGFLPQAAGGALFTSLADRLPPRFVLVSGLLTRALPGLAIGLLPGMPVPVMLVLVGLAALVMPVYQAGQSGLLPDVLDGDKYVLGRSVFTMTASGAQILGLGAGGAVLTVLPARWLLLAAGASLVAAAGIMRVGVRSRSARLADGGGLAGGTRSGGGARPVGGRRGRGIMRATIAGNAELLRSPRVRGLLLAQWLPAWFGTGAEALIVPYALSLGHPASTAGSLLIALPCGMLLSDFAVARFCPPGVRGGLAFPLALLVGVPLLAFAFRPPLPVVAVALFLTGIGFAYPLGLQRAFLDSVPERLRGQGFGLNSTGLMGGQGLLPSAFGGVAVVLGAGGAMAVAGGCVVAAMLALAWFTHCYRRLDAEPVRA